MGSLLFYWRTWCWKFTYWKYIWKLYLVTLSILPSMYVAWPLATFGGSICPWAYLVVLLFCFKLTEVFFFFVTYIESEWQLLLSFIMETVSICPQAFVSSVHHSSAVPNKDHGELNTMLRTCYPFAFATCCWVEIDSCCHGVSHTVVLQKSSHGCLQWLNALEFLRCPYNRFQNQVNQAVEKNGYENCPWKDNDLPL